MSLSVEQLAALFQKEGDAIIRDLRALMSSTGANASGKTSASLLNEVTATEGSARMLITGGTGWAFVEQGRGRTRRKGNGQLRGIIKQWIDDKGIQPEEGMTKDTLSFLITRAIHSRGTLLYLLQERREIYTAVLTEDRLKKVEELAKERVTSAVESQLLKNIKALTT